MTRPEKEEDTTMTYRQVITTPEAPTPAPVFSQGVRHGALLQVSGQGPQDPATGAYLYPGDIKAQTTLALSNVAAILRAGGAGFDDVIMLRVYITNRDDFAAMNQAYGEFLQEAGGAVLPCRTTLIVGLPREEMLIEVDALAVVE